MDIEVECRGCHARYRVKESLAGRMAECKRCGQKFRVPYRSPVIKLGEEEAIDDAAESDAEPSPQVQSETAAQPKPDKATRSFAEYGAVAAREEREAKLAKARARVGEPLIALSPNLTELWLPLSLALLGYGISLYVAIRHLIATPGPGAGLIILAIVLLLFAAVVMPMMIRILEGASMTF